MSEEDDDGMEEISLSALDDYLQESRRQGESIESATLDSARGTKPFFSLLYHDF